MALATFSHLHHLEMAVASQSPVPKRALETIELLRSELERCQVDLEMDEELFAEKVEEVNELQKNYDLLLQEKERIERLWVSAKETETRLQSEVQQLLEKLFSMESELSCHLCVQAAAAQRKLRQFSSRPSSHTSEM